MSSAHSPTFPSLNLHHSSFSNLSVTSPTSQPILFILQHSRHFTYVKAHSARSTTFPSLDLRQSSFCSFFNISVISPTSQLILQPFSRFTHVTAHSPTLSLLPRVTAHSPTLLSLFLRHRLFTYVTWRALHTPKY